MTKLDSEQVLKCLNEIEDELFRLADGDDCQRFHKDTQLTATLLLLFRMSSLIRSLLLLFQSGDFDGFDAVSRAFEETWYLAHEFRLCARYDRTVKWLAGEKNTWNAKIGVLVEFAKGRGHTSPTMGQDYGLLSELYHPTRTAADNAVTICGVRRGIDEANVALGPTRAVNEARIKYALHRLGWLLLDEDPQFIRISVEPQKIPLFQKFLKEYEQENDPQVKAGSIGER